MILEFFIPVIALKKNIREYYDHFPIMVLLKISFLHQNKGKLQGYQKKVCNKILEKKNHFASKSRNALQLSKEKRTQTSSQTFVCITKIKASTTLALIP